MAGQRKRAIDSAGGARPTPRREFILETVGAMFASHGYEATSMRDIGAAVGVMPATLYYHFPSKEDLFVTVVEESVAKIQRAVESAIEGIEDPWERLRAALIAHVGALLDREGFRVLVVLQLPLGISAEARQALIDHRKRFERRFLPLLDPFVLPGRLTRSFARNFVLSLLNSIPIWYHAEGSASPRDVADQLCDMIAPIFHDVRK